jgi:nucleoside-diphosphate-sugar epimerase
MKILCTGADGFVSSNLLPKLSGHEVITLDYLNTIEPINIKPNYKFMNFDLSSGVPPINEKLDLIIHLATVNQLAISANPKLVKVNTAATHNILELAHKAKARLIFSSSCSVYGEGLNLKENHRFNPQSMYAKGKCYEEELIQFHHRHYGLDAIILRFSNCYGDVTRIENKVYPGKKDVIRIFMEKILNDESIPLTPGMGRDYTYINDVVEAVESMMYLDGLHIYNVGTGVETITDDLAEMVIKTLGIPINVEYKPPRETDNILHRSLNIEKISPYWKPKVDLKQGLKRYAACLFD